MVKADEEESVRNAARLINEKVKLYKERFSVKDDLDLVIMCCLELATDNLNQANKFRREKAVAEDQLKEIDLLLNDAILTTEENTPLEIS